MRVKINFIENGTKTLVDQFMDGDDFDPRLSKTVLNTIDRVDDQSYEDVLKKVKTILSGSKREDYQNLFMIEVKQTLSIKEKAVLIRFINLCHKERKFFILLNNELVYFPSEYQGYDLSELHDYVNKQLIHMKHTETLIKIDTTMYKACSIFRSKPKSLKQQHQPKVVRSNRVAQRVSNQEVSVGY